MNRRWIMFLFLSICLSNCSIFEMAIPEYDEFRIINNSEYDIRIDAYGDYYSKDSVLIKSGEEVSRFDSRGPGFRGTFFYFHPDSVFISFNNEKILIQYCDGKGLSYTAFSDCGAIEKNLGNLYSPENREVINKRIKGKKILDRYSIRFDNSDYERAVEVDKIASY